MRTILVTVLGLAAALAVSQTAFADNPVGSRGETAMTFRVDDPMGRNSITFRSTAPLEDIVGTTNQITGFITFDPNKPMEGGHAEFTVPSANLNTGIPLRDEHLRGPDWLDAGRYPKIMLKIVETRNVKEVKSTAGSGTYDATFIGDFSLHGKTRRLEIPGRFTYLKESEKTRQRMPGDLLAVRASFEVPLKDFGITGPKGMDIVGSKVGKSISVDVSIMGNARRMTAGKSENPADDRTMESSGDR